MAPCHSIPFEALMADHSAKLAPFTDTILAVLMFFLAFKARQYAAKASRRVGHSASDVKDTSKSSAYTKSSRERAQRQINKVKPKETPADGGQKR
ncbi:hypothetical protein A0J61_01480 [Choanephora cucurbitarum]|uniref:Uncharacterized protein n=1 Tax=Choanephora cucurbitarum TaxID=101091 RepID=A0A1C7NN92_9FUNG|nr:hypothetical protein A0J61_01480 [Choanephora cucurbitarum]